MFGKGRNFEGGAGFEFVDGGIGNELFEGDCHSDAVDGHEDGFHGQGARYNTIQLSWMKCRIEPKITTVAQDVESIK